MTKSDLPFDANEYAYRIVYAVRGEDRDWQGGPVTKTGYYELPECDPGCCRPKGPYALRIAMWKVDSYMAWLEAARELNSNVEVVPGHASEGYIIDDDDDDDDPDTG